MPERQEITRRAPVTTSIPNPGNVYELITAHHLRQAEALLVRISARRVEKPLDGSLAAVDSVAKRH